MDDAKESARCHDANEFSILASQKDPFDPMEKAFEKLSLDHLAKTEHIHRDWELVKEIRSPRSCWPCLVSGDHLRKRVCDRLPKGAPEAIVDLCHIDSLSKQQLSGAIQFMAEEGLRVSGVSSASFGKCDLPDGQQTSSSSSWV